MANFRPDTNVLVLFLFVIALNTGLLAQSIEGIVIDLRSKKPLIGASVYFDNTTLGTSTDFDGSFTLELSDEIESPLIVSFVGYKTKVIEDFRIKGRLQIGLTPDSNILREVVVSTDDDWPRSLKLSEFRKHFLGESLAGRQSQILNEEDLIFRYSKKRKVLIAESDKPIIVKNNHLNYMIYTELRAFKVNYKKVSKNHKKILAESTYYAGYNRFKALDNANPKTAERHRYETYKGSVLHFMRALARDRLFEEKYRFQVNGAQVDPKDYIKVTPRAHLGEVDVSLKQVIEIIYDQDQRSAIQVEVPKFSIDVFGRHSPVQHVRFGGVMGAQRMGDLLPLDYLLGVQRSKGSL